MRRGFTLVELLLVIAIMGLLGATATGGYRAMVRGMEERGVMQNVNAFIRAAYQRAQVDRQPVAVFFWNETVRSKTADELEVVIGRAVAVRRHGRISRVDGSVLVDEFGDLDRTFMAQGEQEDGATGGGANDALIELYPMDDVSALAANGDLKRSLVQPHVRSQPDVVQFLGGLKTGEQDASNEIPGYGFVVEKSGGVNWRQGMAYGLEFQRLDLPANYIFGSSHSSDAGNPVRGAGTLVFDVGRNNNSGRNTGGTVGSGTIEVNALRQHGTSLEPVSIATSDPPDRRM